MSDPVRLGLSADAPPLAVEAIERAQRDAPDAARLAAIEAGVLAKLALPPGGGGGGGDAGGGPSAPPAGPSGAGGASALSKAGAAVLAAGAAIVAIVVVTRPPSEAPVAPAAQATHTAVDAAPGLAASLAVVEPGPTPISVDDLPAASAAASAAARPSASARPATPDEDPAATERAEVALLAEAQGALAARPAESLARCDEHARRFASGTLVQEREVLAIDALLRLGRRPEAEARASRFRAAFPRSGHLRRIEALLAP